MFQLEKSLTLVHIVFCASLKPILLWISEQSCTNEAEMIQSCVYLLFAEIAGDVGEWELDTVDTSHCHQDYSNNKHHEDQPLQIKHFQEESALINNINNDIHCTLIKE